MRSSLLCKVYSEYAIVNKAVCGVALARRKV